MSEKWRETYDAWKLRSPDDEKTGRWFLGECDCCGKRTGIRRTIYLGVDTFACDECVQ